LSIILPVKVRVCPETCVTRSSAIKVIIAFDVMIDNRRLFCLAPNVHALTMAGQFITFCRNVRPVNEQKVEIFILLLNKRIFSPELLPNSEQKVDEMHVTPSYSPMRLLVAVLFLWIINSVIVKSFIILLR